MCVGVASPVCGQAQSGINRFLTPSDTLHKGRLLGEGIATTAGFSGMMIVLNEAWYNQFDRGKFHFYDDNDEWLQLDKIGHVWTCYQAGRLGQGMLNWAGVEDQKAVLYGSTLGLAFMTGVEVLDGFSEKWGFSWGDMASNVTGSALFAGQELLWDEQRIALKFSIENVNYPDNPEIQDRITGLYGEGFEKLLKDYNAQTYWLSVNPAAFMHDTGTFPKWLNIAVGYSGENMFGGRVNFWCPAGYDDNIRPEDCPPAMRIDYSHINRYRQYYLSFDVDVSKIQSRSPLLRTLLGAANMIKIPAPAIELNSKSDMHFRALR